MQWQEVIEICDASTEVLKRWLDHFNELEDFLEETFPHKVNQLVMFSAYQYVTIYVRMYTRKYVCLL